MLCRLLGMSNVTNECKWCYLCHCMPRESVLLANCCMVCLIKWYSVPCQNKNGYNVMFFHGVVCGCCFVVNLPFSRYYLGKCRYPYSIKLRRLLFFFAEVLWVDLMLCTLNTKLWQLKYSCGAMVFDPRGLCCGCIFGCATWPRLSVLLT